MEPIVDVTKIPTSVIKILELFEAHGYEAYLIGGCVRDLLLSKIPHDYDIATNATPEESMRLLESYGFKVVPIGVEFGTVKVVLPDADVEVTTFRREVYPEYGRGGRRPVVSWARSLAEDVARRDFTINALAMDRHGRVIDLVGGLEDLKRRIIRFVGEPRDRILEDPLRMIRAIRFASVLGFEIEEGSLKAIREYASHIKRISRERIRDEFIKVMEKGCLAKFLKLLEETSLLEYIIPELHEATQVYHAVGLRHHYGESVFQHTLDVVMRLEKLGIRDVPLLLAGMLHDVGKVVTFRKSGTFHGHEVESARLAEEILRRLRFSCAVIREVVTLVRYHMLPHQYVAQSVQVEKWVSRLVTKLGDAKLVEKLLLLAYADAGLEEAYMQALEVLKRLTEQTKPKPLVTGEIILRMFPERKPGAWVRELKEKLYQIQLETSAKTIQEVLEKAVERGILEPERVKIILAETTCC